MLFMFKAETLPILRKVEKTPFLLQKNHHFCCSFWQNSNYWDKKYFPNLHNWDPKTVYFHPFLINIPQFLNQKRVIESFLPKNVFFPCFPPFSHYNSKHNKILGKRGKSVSLEFPYKAACKKLERLNETFSRTQFIFRKGQRTFWKKFFARKGPLPLPNRFLRPTRVHLAPSRSRDLFLFWEFSETKREPGHASTSHHVLKQIRGLLRIPIRSAPFGRKCQCSINFARWKFFKEKFW